LKVQRFTLESINRFTFAKAICEHLVLVPE